MSYRPTALTPAEQAKVPQPGYVPLLWDELELAVDLPPLDRPRIYGFIEPQNQIVKISSDYYLEKYRDNLTFAWMSGTTIADLISKAR